MPNSGNQPHIEVHPTVHPTLGETERTAQMQERVRSLGSELNAVSTQFNNRLTEFSSSVNGKFTELNSSINSIATKLEDRGRAPWTLLIAGGGFFMAVFATVGGLAYAPINAGLIRVEASVDKLADNVVGQKEFRTYVDTATARRDDAQHYTFDRIARLEDALKNNTSSIVPRAEHEEQWKAQTANDVNLQRQIDELRRTFSDVYSPKDELSRLERKLDQLDTMIHK